MNTEKSLLEKEKKSSCLCPRGIARGSGFVFDLHVNHTFWSKALAAINKSKLIELCEEFSIPTKGEDRHRLASNLAKKIDINKGMRIRVGFP